MEYFDAKPSFGHDINGHESLWFSFFACAIFACFLYFQRCIFICLLQRSPCNFYTVKKSHRSQNEMQLNYRKIWLHNRWKSRFEHIHFVSTYALEAFAHMRPIEMDHSIWCFASLIFNHRKQHKLRPSFTFIRFPFAFILFFHIQSLFCLHAEFLFDEQKIFTQNRKLVDNYRIV